MLKKILIDLSFLFFGCLVVSFAKSDIGIDKMHWGTFIVVCIVYFVYKGIKWELTGRGE